jgi:membrane protein YdbS with pleckstrin-like domain
MPRVEAPRRGAPRGEVIFRTRPSLVQALAAFWLFLLGSIGVGLLLRDAPVLALLFSVGLGVFLMLVVVYTAVRNLAARYELTTQELTLRFRGKRVRVPLANLLAVEPRQTGFQRVLGTGDVLIDASFNGELTRLRMRNIPEVERRAGQIRQVIGG